MKVKPNFNKEIIITKKDLPLSCPVKQVWDGHPKVYLDIKAEKMITCPYCGTKYKLVD
ncbi:MAG TPA: zinc-finger domain-containing protein [Candidatus Azoamicus sp.]